MSAAVKYTLARFGMFAAVFLALLPVPMNLLIKAMLALVASAAFSFLLLRKWRDEMAEQLASMAQRRTAEKERLRAALAGDETAAAAGDRAVAPAVEPPDRRPADPPTN
jgi:predicted Kef-type K+ transport protein